MKCFYSQTSDLRTWNSFHIYAVDGSTIQVPESKENYEVFGGNPNKTEKVSPLASVSVLYDVINDILVDVSLHSYRHSERESAKSHMDFLPGFPNSIVLFDRGYPSEDMFRYLNSKGILFLMRVPKSFKKVISEQEDALFTYPASHDKEPLTLRSIHFSLEDGTTEYLITNLTSEQMPVENFPDLYQLRWGVESKYRELKNRLRKISDCLKTNSLVCDAIIYKNNHHLLLSLIFFETYTLKLTTLPVLRVGATVLLIVLSYPDAPDTTLNFSI